MRWAGQNGPLQMHVSQPSHSQLSPLPTPTHPATHGSALGRHGPHTLSLSRTHLAHSTESTLHSRHHEQNARKCSAAPMRHDAPGPCVAPFRHHLRWYAPSKLHNGAGATGSVAAVLSIGVCIPLSPTKQCALQPPPPPRPQSTKANHTKGMALDTNRTTWSR